MRNILYLGLFVVILLTSYLGVNYFWKGWYESQAGKTLSFQIEEQGIKIISNFGLMNSALRVAYIDSSIDENKKDIYIWIYSKYYSWGIPFYKWKDEIKINHPGSYKIYYKNFDGSSDFIKEIEYK